MNPYPDRQADLRNGYRAAITTLTGKTSGTMHKQMLDAMQTALLLLDGELNVCDLNAAAEILLGISDTRVKGQPLASLWRIDEQGHSELQSVLHSGIVYTRRQVTLKLLSGHLITVDYTATPVSGIGAARVLLEIVPRDRFDRIDREEDMLAQYETSRVLVRGLAHEIKNPLGGLRGAAQLLEQELDQPELRDYTRVIIQEADRLRNLVDSMLGPREPPRLEAINVHEVLERVATLLAAEAGDWLTITRDYDPSLPDVHGDHEQLIQALLNICRNAMQSLHENRPEEKPFIILRTRPNRRHTIAGTLHRLVCRIEVVDNGPGIPRDMQERIFYPMISGRADGSGLGLSIAQSIVHQHGGLIECESRPGQTTFSLLIPLEKAT